ncbi:hypothetical protein LEP1GSC173_1414 [Leptospira interrogans str. HAI1594]|nr:hypothetical protein LEP1GSC117_2892 [Leptospira interrogans serovar Icterohaemorrhagiae str. Verdun LP]EKP76156.1 hypothetical protein LEP1GSC173_1414 [Leptospira interrogans str. HAI1594]EMO18754.1 hypothetical protein LEP1GSC167_1785 [Leptospira interrogans serovar Copenhageni str. HAI0188]EMO37478.1 hypothetical protein LEP1GSC177_1905 [Leptospira interrogans str. MMD3731]EMY55161.1 hypothetical protein LEP1GSC204_1424 [Leptospira interrogans serovar Copenhageni str. M20]
MLKGDQQNYFNCPFQCNRNGWRIYFSTTLFYNRISISDILNI